MISRKTTCKRWPDTRCPTSKDETIFGVIHQTFGCALWTFHQITWVIDKTFSILLPDICVLAIITMECYRKKCIQNLTIVCILFCFKSNIWNCSMGRGSKNEQTDRDWQIIIQIYIRYWRLFFTLNFFWLVEIWFKSCDRHYYYYREVYNVMMNIIDYPCNNSVCHMTSTKSESTRNTSR